MVKVRLFASLREVAGVSVVESDAATVRALIDELCDRYGEEFAARLATASVVVDGDRVGEHETRTLQGAREVALLPPFSGG